MLITVAEAASILNKKSRGSIYRKLKTGELESVPGPDGQPLIERSGLEERWAQIARPKASHPLRPAAERMAPPAAPPQPPAKKPPAKKQSTSVLQGEDAEIPDWNVSRARTEFEKANIMELDRRQKEGELLLREDVMKAWDQALAIVRSDILGLASKCKERMPELEPEQVERMREVISMEMDRIAAITFSHDGGNDENI